jgi:hypothetical protein
MGSLVLTGDTSGSVTVNVPLVAGSNTATIAAATGTHYPFTAGTAVNSTSGTAIDFTSIPSWVKRITVMFNGVSTSGTSVLIVQIGSGSITTTGYLGAAGDIVGAAAANYTTGFGTQSAGAAAHIRHGSISLKNVSGNIWEADGIIALSQAAQMFSFAGTVTLSGVLDRVRITTVNGTDTFDAGSINILYE